MLLDVLGQAFRLPDLPDPHWESLRLLLLKRSLVLVLPFLLLYFSATLLIGHPTLPTLAGLSFSILILGLLRLRPDARRFGLWGLALGSEALMFTGQWGWHMGGLAPALYVAAVMGVLGLMLDGPALGLLLLALGLGLDAAAFQRLPLTELGDRIAIGSLGSLSLGLTMSAWGWYRPLRRGWQELDEASRSLSRQRDERQVLTLALFHELKLAQQRLQRSLGFDGAAPWNAALEEARRVQQRADEIRALRDRMVREPELRTQAMDFSRGVMRVILWSSLLLALAGTSVDVLVRGGRNWGGPFAVLVLGGLLFAIRGRRDVPRWMAMAVCLLGPLIMGADVARHWGGPLPVTLAFWSLSILNAGLLLGLRWALGTAVAGVALLIVASLGQIDAGHFTGRSASILSLSWALVSVVCLQAMVWQSAVLKLLDDGRRQLAQGMALRRRLLGTLFHDLANPLMVIIRLAEDGRAGLEGPGDAARARRLCQRLGELLEDNQAWLMSEDDGESRQLAPVDLEPLLAGLADLFNDKLAAKRLGLLIDVEPGLKAVAQPSVLRDSVLGNLLSNAHKFSHAGSSVELSARADGGGVLIQLADRGPGWPEGLRERLEAGADQPSAPGTEGERGQGLGLALAREHVLRMGGSFEVLDREGGGGMVRVRLKGAP